MERSQRIRSVRQPRVAPTPGEWSAHLSRPRAADLTPHHAPAALCATLCWRGRPVARALWNPRDPRGRLLWTDEDAREAFTTLARQLATQAVPSCRRPVPTEAANQLMVYLVRQASLE